MTPFPTGAAADLPAATHDAYEEAIRAAGREAGQLFLDAGNVRRAWFYFNMLGEPAAVRDHLAAYKPGEDDDISAAVEIALYQGANPQKGFDLVVDRYGICSAITTFGGQDWSRFPPAAKRHAIGRLIRALYEQLRERLRNDAETRGEPVLESMTVGAIITARPELCADGAYHVDTSHLSSVCLMALELEAGPDLVLARELCEYGSHLSESFGHDADPPFERTYRDYAHLLDLIAGKDVEANLVHFRNKIDPALAEQNTFPAEVFVNILLKLGRTDDGLRCG